MDPAVARAKRLLKAEQYEAAVRSFHQLLAESHLDDASYQELAQGLAMALSQLGRHRQEAYVTLLQGDLSRALELVPSGLDRARILEQSGAYLQAAELYQDQGEQVLAAIAYERGKAYDRAIPCWERSLGINPSRMTNYVKALITFCLGYCHIRLDAEAIELSVVNEAAGPALVIKAQRLLEEVADDFERNGKRERAFDCYQVLLEMGRRSGAFENLAEGYLNCIRILKEDNLKFYVLQYYEDFLREALNHEEYHAAASMYREAAEYCQRVDLVYDQFYLKAAAETWVLCGNKNLQDKGPPELSENAYLAAVACFNLLGDYYMVGEVYHVLSRSGLADRRQQRYGSLAKHYHGASRQQLEAPSLPSTLKKAHSYPEIWYQDLVEWAQDGAVEAVCAEAIGNTSYPAIVRRRALDALLDCPEQETGADPDHLARLAEKVGRLQIYTALGPLERLFKHTDSRVQHGVMQALRFLFFKRSFALLSKGLVAPEERVRGAAIEALRSLSFRHAFDPLVRIFREHEAPEVRRAALESIGRSASLQAGDFLVEVLRNEPEPLRSLAKRLLSSFENQEILPILRQHKNVESGPVRADLEAILQQLEGTSFPAKQKRDLDRSQRMD